MNAFAMVVGYGFIVGLALLGVFGLLHLACNLLWQQMLRDIPSMLYFREAVAHYKKVKPPGEWLEEER